MNTTLEQMLKMLNSNKFNDFEFLSTIAAIEYVEMKEHVCESLYAIGNLLKERKKYEEKIGLIESESENELDSRVVKELLETDTTFRNIERISSHIRTYSEFEQYCASNKIRNSESRFSDIKQIEIIKKEKTTQKIK